MIMLSVPMAETSRARGADSWAPSWAKPFYARRVVTHCE